ncbi:MAG: hypothetical protein IJ457_01280 [Clostridia bacterium]|nr:hypothetical protein [Clostridia bacterium]
MKKILCVLLASLFLITIAVSCADNKTDEQTTSNFAESAATFDETTTAEESSSKPTESTEMTTIAESASEPAVTEVVTTVPPETNPAEVTLSEPKPVVTEAPVTNVPVTEPTESTPSALVIPENGEILEGAPYPDPLGLTAFSNVKELYEYLKNMPEKELDKILSMEQWYLWDTVQTIHVSKAELQHGIFGYFRNSILSSGAVVVPHLNGSPMGLGEGRSIELETAQFYRKTQIVYPSEQKITFYIMKYDPEFIDEARDNGASWLIYKLNPELMNLHNYEELIAINVANGIKGVKDMTVYEKEYELGDRKVKTLVYDSSKLSDELLSYGMKPCLELFFVYDDLLIKALGQPDDIMNVLPGLTFEEVKLEG